MSTTVTFKQTLEEFIKSDEFAESVIGSTKAGFGGSSYKVELFPDGTWRVLWSNQIGNIYDSPGIIQAISSLSDDDYQAFVDMAGSDDSDALVKELRNTDALDEIAQQMRNSLHDELAMQENY